VTAVFRSGYSLGERLVRPAVVVVTGPEHDSAGPAADSAGQPLDAEPIIADEAFGSATAGEAGNSDRPA
jgi:hypothetical protein